MDRVTMQIAEVRSGVVWISQGDEFYEADDSIIIAEGAADSVGFVVISESGAKYITNTQVDTAYMLQKLSELCDHVISIGNTATYAIPSVGVAPNAELQAIAVEVQSLKAEIDGKELV